MIDQFNFDSLEDAAIGEEVGLSDDERHYLYRILYETTFDCDQRGGFIMKIKNCDDIDELARIKKNLLMNRIEDKDRISMGFTYNMGDIKQALKHLRENV